MAQLVIAAAGAALGGFLGPGAVLFGMTGAQLGWMAGSMLGSALAPTQRTSGPRLDELRVTGSEYGAGIPWVAGAPRVAGDLIWASDRREIATTEEVGKGGGAEYTTYTYEVDAMYLLADQPGCTVTRIWENGKLVWTNLTSADDASRLASEGSEKWRRITVYDGGDAQLPDPVYDAAVSDAPAYTRRLTVFIEAMQLGSSGMMPNLTFEVASHPDTSPNFSRRYEVADTGREFGKSGSVGLGYPAILSIQPTVRVTILDDVSTLVYLYGLNGQVQGTDSRTLDENFPSVRGAATYPVGMMDSLPVRVANHFYAIDGAVTHIRAGVKTESGWGVGLLPNLASVLPSGRFLGDTMTCSDGVHLMVFTAPVSAYFGSSVLDRWHIIRRDGLGQPVLVDSGDIDPPRPWRAYGCVGQENYSYSCAMLEDDLQHVWYAIGASSGSAEMLKIGPDRVLRTRSILDYAILQRDFTYPAIWAQGSFAVVLSGKSYQAFRRTGDSITEVSLRTVVEALCERATMPSGTYDASALAGLTTPVRAIAVANGSARQALQILQASHGFDAFVTDKLRFVPRGGAPALTIDAQDLAAGDSEASGEPFALTINADLEIPNRVAVVFKNMSADQIAGTEHSDRGPSGQDSIQTVQLAVGMLPAEAKGVADAMVRDAFAARLTSTLALPMSYTRITPTDVLQVPDFDGTLYRMRVVRRSDSGGILTLDVVGDDGAIVVQPMQTSGDYEQATVVEALAETSLQLLDIPLLRDADDAPGIYVAAKGGGARWPGCSVLMSADGTVFSAAAAVAESAVIGTATTVLGAWGGGWVVDEQNSVTVNVGAGQLSSITRDSMIADRGANALLVGDEVIRFASAALVSASPNVYRLTRLLRGQRGTEWATGGHAVGDRVVLLRARGLRRVTLSQLDFGRQRTFKGVTSGQPIAAAPPLSITVQGVSQKPPAPVDLRITRLTGGDVVLDWKRRTRRATTFLGAAGSVVPLGEDSEAYDVEVRNPSNALVSSQRVMLPSAGVGLMSVVRTYAEGMAYPRAYGSEILGLQVEGQGPRYWVAHDATGNVVRTSAAIGDWVTDAVYAGDNLYAVAYTETATSPSYLTTSTIGRYDLADLSTRAAVWDALAAASDAIYGCAWDGTNIWTVGALTGKLRKHDATSLAVLADYAIGTPGTVGVSAYMAAAVAGAVFISGVDNTKVVRFATSSATIAWTVDLGVRNVQIVAAGSVLFVGTAVGVTVLDAATGSTVASYTDGAPLGATSTHGLVVLSGGAEVAYRRNVSGDAPSRFLSTSTGAVTRELRVPGVEYIAGEVGGNVLGTGSPTASFGFYRSYELTWLASLSGYTATVYQVSAAVGRGYPSTVTL